MKPWLAVLVAILAIATTGCNHHTVAAAPPPPAPPPASAAAPPVPVTVPEPEPPKTEPTPTSPATTTPTTPPPSTSSVPVTRPTAKPKDLAPQTKAKTDPSPPPAPTASLRASLPPAEAADYRKRAERAIAESEQNIDAVKQVHLSGHEQSTLRDARSFLKKAQKALEDGDLVRAATLAEKSRQLSEEVRRRTES